MSKDKKVEEPKILGLEEQMKKIEYELMSKTLIPRSFIPPSWNPWRSTPPNMPVSTARPMRYVDMGPRDAGKYPTPPPSALESERTMREYIYKLEMELHYIRDDISRAKCGQREAERKLADADGIIKKMRRMEKPTVDYSMMASDYETILPDATEAELATLPTWKDLLQ